jgi:N-acetylglucosaminyldiphosphoundecaprenol N-acetyl-beta-D-mannosaminyltransferase
MAATEAERPFLLSTPNVNFMAESHRDPGFRESLLQSDHCCPDGMPIVWISRLLGIPIKQRVSGSDLFQTLRTDESPSRPLKVFLFGGSEGVAETVCNLLNARSSGLRCVGWFNPGVVTVDEMSENSVIERINVSEAGLLAVFLSAKKAQFWLHQNHDRLRTPVRAQFGATINYQAGIVRRAPIILQRLGFEWLWRIKEEPYLWRRYGRDGLFLLTTVITRLLPIAADFGWRRYIQKNEKEELSFWKHEHHGFITVGLIGFATKMHVMKSIEFFRSILVECRDVAVDISQTRSIDPRFFGLLLMIRKQLRKEGKHLKFTGVSKRMRRMFRLNGFEFLLESGSSLDVAVNPTRSKMSN